MAPALALPSLVGVLSVRRLADVQLPARAASVAVAVNVPTPRIRIVTLTAAGHAALRKPHTLRDYLPAETVQLLVDNGYGPAKFEAAT